jgi:hypothetical protein
VTYVPRAVRKSDRTIAPTSRTAAGRSFVGLFDGQAGNDGIQCHANHERRWDTAWTLPHPDRAPTSRSQLLHILRRQKKEMTPEERRKAALDALTRRCVDP